MKKTLILVLLIPASLTAQDELQKSITFRWDEQKQQGFTSKTQEIDRYDILHIDVNTDALDTRANTAELTNRITFLKNATQAFTQAQRNTITLLREQTDALRRAVVTQQKQDIEAARTNLERTAQQLATALMPVLQRIEADKDLDRPTYDALSTALLQPDGYNAAAGVLQQRIDALTTELRANIAHQGAIAITATLIPPDDAARTLAVPPYNDVQEAASDAAPNVLPVVDDRTRREVAAAQGFRDVLVDLQRLDDELRNSINDLRATLLKLRDELKIDVLEKTLDDLIMQAQTIGTNDLASVVQEARAARDLLRALAAPDLAPSGATDADRLLAIASTLLERANALLTAANDLPTTLTKLTTDVRAALVQHASLASQSAVTLLETTAKAFGDRQTYFTQLAGTISKLAMSFRQAGGVSRSAQDLVNTARDISAQDLNTRVNLRRIIGDVHTGDHLDVDAILYTRKADGSLASVDEATQRFVIERYGIYPDNVRGALLFVDPRNKIPRDIRFQPVPALGYFWKTGFKGHPRLNRALPGLGFSMALVDFEDKDNFELGLAATVSLFDIFWTGYGRDLQARANYFSIGINPLYVGRLLGGMLSR
jgi:hypothetical protein